jgi:hypothetical protein
VGFDPLAPEVERGGHGLDALGHLGRQVVLVERVRLMVAQLEFGMEDSP